MHLRPGRSDAVSHAGTIGMATTVSPKCLLIRNLSLPNEGFRPGFLGLLGTRTLQCNRGQQVLALDLLFTGSSQPPKFADYARLSPLVFTHINPYMRHRAVLSLRRIKKPP